MALTIKDFIIANVVVLTAAVAVYFAYLTLLLRKRIRLHRYGDLPLR